VTILTSGPLLVHFGAVAAVVTAGATDEVTIVLAIVKLMEEVQVVIVPISVFEGLRIPIILRDLGIT
jgi:hypothetical protein